MRLPYLQVTQETWTKAGMLAGLLCIKPREARGLLLDLWQWGLDLGQQDEAPSGICPNPKAARMLAGALQWEGDADELVAALCDIGVAEALDGGGLRVRGMDRYRRTWEKNRRVPVSGAKPARVVPVSGTFPAETGAKPARQTQTQTQTQTQKETTTTSSSAEIRAEPLKPGRDFYLWAQGKREELRGLVPDTQRDPPGDEIWYAQAEPLAGNRSRLEAAFLAFLGDAYWGGRRRYPWPGFVKQCCEKYLPAKSTGPPVEVGACSVCGSTRGDLWPADGGHTLCGRHLLELQDSGEIEQAEAWIARRRGGDMAQAGAP